jgi:class 3 adenylate cyclase/tetratricopeptide (TPR) repeat protein
VEGGPRAIERKVITALFCDVVGSTELAERLDPEDVDRLMRTYHSLARRRVESHGGSVEKFIGDAVVGVFGAPAVHEDDPSRAVHAALSIVRELATSDLDLQVRIGIQTGEAVVAVAEHRRPEEGYATGDILNTAARLQGVASPGGIAVGDATYRMTRPEFEWEDLGKVAVKGKAQPVQVWRPIHEVASEEAPTATEATPFLGREADLGRVLQAFEDAAAARRIELVTILAEPGMGKSRLVRELGRRALARSGVSWHKGRCLPYGDGISFWALGEIVKSHAGILETDDQATLLAKLDTAIAEPDAAVHAWVRDCLAPLVGLRTEVVAPRQEDLFSAWTRYLTSIAAAGPAVIVVEDLHWADPAMVEFLIRFADATDAVPLLIVVTARPEVADRHPTWLARASRSSVVQLVSLDESSIRALLERSLAGASDALATTVLERAAGSPLYAEQLAALARERRLEDPDAVLDESIVPPTIQALLAARIDSLPGELKPTLLDASVVGRVFWSGAVATLAGAEPAAVGPALEALVRRELTREQVPSTMFGEAEYGFWHALLRDVAYSFLPRAARFAKHRAAAAWITERAQGSPGDVAEIVADHLRRALDLATALHADADVSVVRADLATALIAAGEHTLLIEPARSVDQLRGALDLIDADDGRRPFLLERLGRALASTSRGAERVEALEAAASAYRARGDEVAAATVAFALASAYRAVGAAPKALAVVEAARPILEANPGPGLVDAHAEAAVQAAYRDDLDLVVAESNAALDLAATLGLPKPYRALGERGLALVAARKPGGDDDVFEAVELALVAGDSAAALSFLSNRAEVMTTSEAALAAYDEALAFAARYGLSTMELEGQRLDWLGISGRWDEVLESVPRIRDEARARGHAYNLFMTTMFDIGLRAARGEPTEGAEEMTGLATAIGFRPYIPGGNIAQAKFFNGDPEGARRVANETLAMVGDGEYTTNVVTLVEVALDLHDLELAHRVLAKAYPEDGQRGTRSTLTQLATAMVLEADGEITAARSRYDAAATFFTSHGWLESEGDARAGLGRCQVAMGDREEGLANLRRSLEIWQRLKVPRRVEDLERRIS